MKKLLILLALVSNIGYAGEILPASKAIAIVKEKDRKFDELYYGYCKNGISYQIEEAAKEGKNYVHIDLDTSSACYGLMSEQVVEELKKLGYKVNLSQSVGIESVHYTEILTVAW